MLFSYALTELRPQTLIWKRSPQTARAPNLAIYSDMKTLVGFGLKSDRHIHGGICFLDLDGKPPR